MPNAEFEALRKRLKDALPHTDLAEHADAVLAAAEPYVHLQSPDEAGDEDKLPIGASRFGFVPDLPPGVDWPTFEGKKLMFIAQIDLSAMPRWEGSALPADGWLYVFALFPDQQSKETPWRWRGVVFHHKCARELLVRAEKPAVEDLWVLGNTNQSTEDLLPLSGKLSLTVNPARLGEEASDAAYELEEFYESHFPRHTESNEPMQTDGFLLGNPVDIDGTAAQMVADLAKSGVDPTAQQLASEPNGPAEDWISLLTVYSHGSFEWGDCGILYFLIRPGDLAKADFSRVCMGMSSG